MNGHKYEHRCAQMLRRKGFHHVEVTKKSGDQGVDIIAYKHFSKYAIQCKYYSYPVGNKAVQEVYAGGKYYDCDRCIVMTNGTFTKAAISAANKLDVKLWENCSLLKSTSLVFEVMRIMNILEIILGFYLLRNAFPFSQREFLMYYREFCLIFAGILGWLGFGNWGASTLCGCLVPVSWLFIESACFFWLYSQWNQSCISDSSTDLFCPRIFSETQVINISDGFYIK